MLGTSPKHVGQPLPYWAFLSYSSKDAAFARKLHRRLERYRYPRDLVGRPGRDEPVPKRIFPVFRDREELPLSSDLGATIQDALRASRYLVVICSPNAAKSRWVNQEIRYFKSLGRSDRILAVIIDGEPNASDEPGTAQDECFPEALRFEVDGSGALTTTRSEPIAGDLRKGGDGWSLAFSKAVAGISGLGLDTIVQRERKRKRRKVATTLVSLLGVAAAGLWGWDGYLRQYREYYETVQPRFGEYQGIQPIPRLQLKDYPKAIETLRVGRRNPIRELRMVNGNGEEIEPIFVGISTSILGQQLGSNQSAANAKPVSRVVLTRNQRGEVSTEEAFYFDGSKAYEFHYLGSGVVSFQLDGVERQRAPGIASRARVTYHESGPGAGIIKEVEFIDAYGKPARLDIGALADQFPELGIFGFSTDVVGEEGRGEEIHVYFVGQSGDRMLLDSHHHIVALLDEKSRPAGFATHQVNPDTGETYEAMRSEFRYDEKGQLKQMVSVARESPNHPPVSQVMELNLAKSRMEMVQGNTIIHSYLGERGRQLLEERKFDVFGYVVNEGILQNLTLATSTRYRDGFYQIPTHVFIQGFVKGSPGREAGLKAGDLILSYAGTPLHGVQELIQAVQAHSTAEQAVAIEVSRDGVVQTIDVPPGSLGAVVEHTVSITEEIFYGNQPPPENQN